MSYFEKLDTDIWINILALLTHDNVPKPLSGWVKEETFRDSEVRMMELPSVEDPGVTTRRDIRVPELAALMSTSIAFNQLAAIPLYRRVITDSVQALSYNYRKPAARQGVESKQQLLGHTRYLHLEFRQKGTQPMYREIMAEGKYWSIIGAKAKEDTVSIEAGIEAAHILSAFTLLAPTSSSPRTAFPSLNFLSLASIFSPYTRMWDHALSEGHTGDFFELATGKMDSVFAASPIIDLCSRGGSTPYSMPSIIDWPQKATTPSTSPFRCTLHFEYFDKYMRAAIAHDTRWIMEHHQRWSNLDANHLAQMTTEALLDVVDQRKGYKGFKDQRFHLEVYASTNLAESQEPMAEVGTYWGVRTLMDEDAERAKTKEFCQEAKRAMKEDGRPQYKGDTFSWKAMIDAPPCMACGWTYRSEEMEGFDCGKEKK